MSKESAPIVIAGATHPGKQRLNNEDSYAIAASRHAAIVADGMGGLASGERASKLVTTSVIAALAAHRRIADGIAEAHRLIIEESGSTDGDRMGSTAVGFEIQRMEARISWVGDSRAYLWRNGGLRQLSRDHSYVTQLVELGAIKPEEAEEHPHRHILTRAVGIAGDAQLDIETASVSLQARDRLLLCTDGLHGYVSEALISECLTRIADVQRLADALIDLTLQHSEAGDNVTVVCAGVMS